MVSSIPALSGLNPHPLNDDRKSKESPALAAQLRAFSVISSSLRAELSTSGNHYVGKVSAFADVFSDRSHPLTGCQRYCGRRRLLSSPSTSAMSVWERLVHPRLTGLSAREARLATPYGQDRHGLHYAYAPLRPHQTCRRKEVRLRLDLFDARFILSGSVIRYATDTSFEGERRRETVTAGVPLLCTPSLPDSQSGIAPFHSDPSVPGLYAPGASVPPLRLRNLRGVCRACNQSRHSFLLQSLRLHSVTQAPSAGPALTSEVRCH